MSKGSKAVIEGVRRHIREDDAGNELVYYTGTISSEIAKAITFVPVMKNLVGRKSPLVEIGNGYQRPGSGPRMKTFSKYLHIHPLAIVPPVLLSTRDRWIFEESEDEDDFDSIGKLIIDTPIYDNKIKSYILIKRWMWFNENFFF